MTVHVRWPAKNSGVPHAGFLAALFFPARLTLVRRGFFLLARQKKERNPGGKKKYSMPDYHEWIISSMFKKK
jgi:hypothetical protein